MAFRNPDLQPAASLDFIGVDGSGTIWSGQHSEASQLDLRPGLGGAIAVFDGTSSGTYRRSSAPGVALSRPLLPTLAAFGEGAEVHGGIRNARHAAARHHGGNRRGASAILVHQGGVMGRFSKVRR